MERKHNRTNEEVFELMVSIYKKCYDHIFTNCKYVPDKKGFRRSSAVRKPLTITEDEASIIFSHVRYIRRSCFSLLSSKKSYEITDETPPSRRNTIYGICGLIDKAPHYIITFIDAEGNKYQRMLLTRNNKLSMINDDDLKNKIMYIVEMNETYLKGGKYVQKIENGVVIAY